MTTQQQPFTSIHPPLSPGTLSYINQQKYPSMTPVQSATIPLFLTHKDVCVKAATGSGKTLAYLIPMVEMLLRKEVLGGKELGGIVVCPTRELAQQVYTICSDLIQCHDDLLPPPLLTVGTIRTPIADVQHWHKVQSDILIGTPGRIEDLLTRYNEFQLGNFECLVLDEADLLLSMGFQTSLEAILRCLPKWKRVGLFSATMDGGVRGLARAGMRYPVMVDVSINSKKKVERITPSSLTNYYTIVDLRFKLDALVNFIIKRGSQQRIVVFFISCASVEFYGLALSKLKQLSHISISTLHGKMHQKRRSLSLSHFLNKDNNNENKDDQGGVLLCTDVVSRGIDFNDVHWVLQYDPPTDPAAYVHRVGRAGRAQKVGNSLVFLTSKEDAYVEFLKLRKVPLLEYDAEELDAGGPDKKNDDVTSSELNESNIIREIKDATLKSRDLLEKGTRAYTSYVRAYREHQCSFIFREKSLDLGHLATSFCLLKLPKMPELGKIHMKVDFKPEPNVEFYKIPYEDKVREKARQARMQDERKTEKLAKRREEKKQKREEKQKKAEERIKMKANRKRVGKHQQILAEWDDLAKEERLHKKLKRGKISQAEYDRQMYGDKKSANADNDLDDLSDIE